MCTIASITVQDCKGEAEEDFKLLTSDKSNTNKHWTENKFNLYDTVRQKQIFEFIFIMWKSKITAIILCIRNRLSEMHLSVKTTMNFKQLCAAPVIVFKYLLDKSYGICESTQVYGTTKAILIVRDSQVSKATLPP